MTPTRAGPYLLGELLGRGGMGSVYRARHEAMQRDAAVKLLNPQTDKELAARLEREAVAAARLDHPGIVRVYDFGRCDDGSPFMAMELVEGAGFDALLERGGSDMATRLRIVRDAALALGAAHEKGIIHRDMKPSNIMVATDGTVKITDFGIARLLDAQHTRLTATGAMVGTPAYMAPEQLSSSFPVTPQTDVYALGATLYEAASGRPPVDASTIPQMIYQIVHQLPRPPSEEIPASARDPLLLAADAICARAMQKKPPDRYASARDMAAAIDDALRGKAVATGTAPAGAGATPPRPLRPALVAAAVTVAVAMIGGAALVGLALGDANQGHAPAAPAERTPQADVSDVPAESGAQVVATKAPDQAATPAADAEETAVVTAGPVGPAPTETDRPAAHAAASNTDTAAVTQVLQSIIDLDPQGYKTQLIKWADLPPSQRPSEAVIEQLTRLMGLVRQGVDDGAHADPLAALKNQLEPAHALALQLAEGHAPSMRDQLTISFEWIMAPAYARLLPIKTAYDTADAAAFDLSTAVKDWGAVATRLRLLREHLGRRPTFKNILGNLAYWLDSDITRLKSHGELRIDLSRDPSLGRTLGATSDAWLRQPGTGLSRPRARDLETALELTLPAGIGGVTLELQVLFPAGDVPHHWLVDVSAGDQHVILTPWLLAVTRQSPVPSRVAEIMEGARPLERRLDQRGRVRDFLAKVAVKIKPIAPGDTFHLHLLRRGTSAGLALLHSKFHHSLPRWLLGDKRATLRVSVAGHVAIRSLTIALRESPPLPAPRDRPDREPPPKGGRR